MKAPIRIACERGARGLATLCLAGGLVACGIAPYQPAPQETLAPVRLVGLGNPRMCVDGKLYSLSADASQTVQVPVGKRVTLGSYMFFDGYNVSFNCTPQLSFMPQAGQRYVSNAGLRDQRCFVELVREDAARDTGVAPEPSLGPPGDCSKPK